MDKEYLLITGASSGIGRQIAIDLSQHYRIVLGGRDKERLEGVAAACSADEHLIWDYDLAQVEGVERSLANFLAQNDCRIAGFVHSAGYMKTVPMKMASVELFQSSFNVNVTSAAMIVKVLASKRANGDALRSAVLVSSNISNFGAKAFAAYAASKAAADGLMRCLAVELAPRVRVNSVLPGGVRTAMTEHMYQDQTLIERMAAAYPLGLGKPQDISRAVSFLLSDDARWITGQQLTVDGGRTINITG